MKIAILNYYFLEKADPELGVTKCYYCKQKLPLLTPNKEQKDFMKEYEKEDSGENPKYCAGCLARCDKKIESRKRKRIRDFYNQESSSESKTISYEVECKCHDFHFLCGGEEE